MLGLKRKVRLQTERLTLRPPTHADFRPWAMLRAEQSGTTGYWIGERYARQGFMREAIEAMVHYAFTTLDLSRIEAGCLPENMPSRSLLEKCGYKYEGVAQSYLQINGRWRNHVLYANLRYDRRGKTSVLVTEKICCTDCAELMGSDPKPACRRIWVR